MIIVWPLAIQGCAVMMFGSSPPLPNSGTLCHLMSSQTLMTFPFSKSRFFYFFKNSSTILSFLTFLFMKFFYRRFGLDEFYSVRACAFNIKKIAMAMHVFTDNKIKAMQFNRESLILLAWKNPLDNITCSKHKTSVSQTFQKDYGERAIQRMRVRERERERERGIWVWGRRLAHQCVQCAWWVVLVQRRVQESVC